MEEKSTKPRMFLVRPEDPLDPDAFCRMCNNLYRALTGREVSEEKAEELRKRFRERWNRKLRSLAQPGGSDG